MNSKKPVRHRPISLVLPYIPLELQGGGLPKIIEELKYVSYLQNIIVTIGRANAEEFRQAKAAFSALPVKPKLIWCTGGNSKSIWSSGR